jgi:predicted dehydrogenase
MVGYQIRFHPCLRWIREGLLSQTFGRILGVRIKTSSYLPDWHPYEDYKTLYAARPDLGGGVILTESHEIDYCLWLFGIPQRVYTVGGNLSPVHLEVEDTAHILMEYERPGETFPVHLDLSFMSRPPQRSLEISAERGRIVWDTDRWDTVRFFDAEANGWKEKTFPGWDRNRLFEEEAKHFLLCLEGKAIPLPSLEEAAQGLKVILAAKRSHLSGQVVEVDRILEKTYL